MYKLIALLLGVLFASVLLELIYNPHARRLIVIPILVLDLVGFVVLVRANRRKEADKLNTP